MDNSGLGFQDTTTAPPGPLWVARVHPISPLDDGTAGGRAVAMTHSPGPEYASGTVANRVQFLEAVASVAREARASNFTYMEGSIWRALCAALDALDKQKGEDDDI